MFSPFTFSERQLKKVYTLLWEWRVDTGKVKHEITIAQRRGEGSDLFCHKVV